VLFDCQEAKLLGREQKCNNGFLYPQTLLPRLIWRQDHGVGSDRQSHLQNWAVKSPDWAVDARFMTIIPLFLIVVIALFADPWLAGLCLLMLLGLVLTLSLEPISGVLIIIIGPAVAFFVWGSSEAIISALFLLLLATLGFLWTLRSIRFEVRRAQRVAGKKRQTR
jgi:hypothetical protein